LCADCVKDYLQPDKPAPEPAEVTSIISKQLKLGQTTRELAELDDKECPICGITFYEFRQGGRLGCPHDYVFFAEELEPLLNNVHGSVEHAGKKPQRGSHDTQPQTELIRLRREMKEAVDREDYELASQLRDRIKSVEGESRS
jgi:protein arginine kinase activator